MRVLHVGKYYPPYAGGMENFLGDLLPALERRGVRTGALVHNHRGGWERGEDRPGQPWLLRVPTRGTLLYAPVSPAFPRALRQSLREFRPDLLHCHMPNTSVFWALGIAAAGRIPWIVHWHADVVASRIDRRMRLAYPLYRVPEGRVLRRARAVVASSPPYLDSSGPLRPWKAKCRVVPLGLDPGRLKPPAAGALQEAERSWGGTDGLRVLSVGRLTYYKGHDVLVRAAARVPAVRAVIVGTGSEEAGLRRLIARQGVPERVALVGLLSHDALNAMLATCDVLCLASKERTEAFGLVLLEAMRYERPVVAGAIPGSGVGWVVEDGKTGFLVEPGDDEALAGALARMAADPDRRRAMGRAAGRRFFERFHIDRIAEAMSALYTDVLGAGG